MFQSRYDNIHPDHIDYTLIDRPLRRLVKAINKSSWAKTIGSCAGRACHIITPNLLHGNDSVTRPVMGKGWFKFEIGLHRGVTPLNKEQTRGGIKALEFGWKAVVKCSQKTQCKI